MAANGPHDRALGHVALAERIASPAVHRFADEVGLEGRVRVVGAKTQWEIGRRADDMQMRDIRADDMQVNDMRADDMRAYDMQMNDIRADFRQLNVRELRAPDGVIDVQPSELIVRVGAGTPVADLDVALAEVGLQCPLDPASTSATVGGVLSVGRSGVRRLRHGHVRDTVLEALYVSADGVLRRAGAPVVKNVTGFDLPRLLVGSIGTLGLIAEVVLRCGPLPQRRGWWSALNVDPWEVRRSLFRPSSILWDGTRTYVQLEGSEAEVHAEVQALPGASWEQCEPPTLPDTRSLLDPTALKRLRHEDASAVFGVLTPEWIAEIGAGVVHGVALPAPPMAAPVLDLNRRMKDALDPAGRLNPGVLPW